MRRVSLLFALLSLLVPPAWAYWQFETMEVQHFPGGGACGMPVMAVFSLAAIGVCFLSFVAVGFGAWALFRIPRPWSWVRLSDVVFLALPFIVAAAFYAWVWGWLDA
jgi:hypothetical protein